jgi:hypothetical protein
MAKVLTDRDADETQMSEEWQRVVDHRLRWLLAAGYNTHNAEKIAFKTTIDWHFACELLKNGCAEKTALEILL